MTELTQDRLRELLDYYHLEGVFRWRVSPKPGMNPGDAAGTKNDKGYIVIKVDKRYYRAHNLAWLYHYGRWPDGVLDHRNRKPWDNRIGNLRECSPSQNQFNRAKQSNNTSGYKGVSYDPRRRKFQAGIGIGGRRVPLGRFDTAEEAYAAYLDAAARIHGEFASA